MPGRRWLGATLACVAALLAIPSAAHADPAEPTDYRSEVVAIMPETPTIAVEVVGGDSFLRLRAQPGTEVVVLGYQNEPFLRVRADGVVEHNARSPSTYLSLDRMGGAAVPAHADATLPPLWHAIGSGGTYAWHDHRAHWMSPDPPPDARRGDRIQTGAVPLVVDGVPVTVSVATDWLPAPSPVPLYVGAGLAAAGIVLALAWRGRVAWPVVAVAAVAAGVGAWQYVSLPPETGPLLVWWLLPAVAAVSALAAVALGRRLLAGALLILAGLELAAWVYVRRQGAFRALTPTDAPLWLDRGVLAATAVVAVAGLLGGLVTLYRPSTD